MFRLLVIVLAVAMATALTGSAADAETIATNSPDGQPLSQRVVAYDIDARLDTAAKTLDATETLAYKNLTNQALESFPFHLYLNAFRPESTFSFETHRYGGVRGDESEQSAAKTGGIEIRSIKADGYGDLSHSMQFIAPDDDNPDDHTVMMVRLPHPLAPGATVKFHISFHDKFPESVARNGYKRDFIMGGQWFPKVGVFWHDAWNCHQYHATTEFFSDFGTYDVKLNVPERYLVGASGVQTGEAAQPDHTKTLTFRAEDVHDFAFAASPHFVVEDDTFKGTMGPVKIHALVLQAHEAQRQRYVDVLHKTMQRFEDWYGPYPYKQITLIDPEPDSQMEGMEYPTLFTAGTQWFAPRGLLFPEGVTEHEYGHQYWYGMVATNEFEEAWLDEGINQYTEGKVMSALYGKTTSTVHLGTVHGGDIEVNRLMYVAAPDYDPPSREAWKFATANSYGGVTYGKTASALLTLESIIGEDTMQRAMHTYFMRYRFKHPTGSDFVNTVIGVSGQDDVEEYFKQAIYGTSILDYAVEDVSSERVKWWKEDKDSNGQYRSSVLVHRKGEFVLPVTLEVCFDDGNCRREIWDGNDRWKRYDYMQKARAVSAEVDPDHKNWLDADLLNNGYRAKPAGAAAAKLTGWVAYAAQLLAQSLSWLV